MVELSKNKSSMKKFSMKRAKNGYILTGPDGDIVFQTDDYSPHDDVERFIEFLYEIIDAYGPEQSRYGHKMRVVYIPGDKNDEEWEKLKSCPVCYQEIRN